MFAVWSVNNNKVINKKSRVKREQLNSLLNYLYKHESKFVHKKYQKFRKYKDNTSYKIQVCSYFEWIYPGVNIESLSFDIV